MKIKWDVSDVDKAFEEAMPKQKVSKPSGLFGIADSIKELLNRNKEVK